jgi:multiple sugar transport system ATP-binding protein
MNLLRGKLVPRDKELLFEATGIDGTSDRLSIQINVKSAPSLESFGGREIILGVRPEDILNKTDADGSFQALVEAVEHMGSEIHLFVKCCGQTIVSRAPADLTLRPQANAMFGLDLEKVRFFDVSTGNRIA